MTELLGRPIRYQPASVPGFVMHCRRRDEPWGLALVQAMLHYTLRFGADGEPEPTLERNGPGAGARMNLVVVGLGRTGTVSIVQALEQLGLRTISQREAFEDTTLLEDLNRAARGDARFDWRRLSGADATAGWPLCYLFAEQLVQWPDATCLLNLRAPDAWYDSIERAWPVLSLVRRVRWGRKPRAVNGMIDLLVDRMGGLPERTRWTAGYRAWLDHVRSSVPPDRLAALLPGSSDWPRGRRLSPRRNHDIDVRRPCSAQRGVERPGVVGSIAPEGRHGLDDLPQESLTDHRVVRSAVGELGRLDEAAIAYGEVEPTPAPPLVRAAVLVGMPLAVSHDLQASRVDDQVDGTLALAGEQPLWCMTHDPSPGFRDMLLQPVLAKLGVPEVPDA